MKKKALKIIGFSYHRNSLHDNSVTLIEDNKILFAEAEERISRVKHDGRFPYLALKEILKLSKTKISQVDYFVSGNPDGSFWKNLKTSLRFIPVVGIDNFIFHSLYKFKYRVDIVNDNSRPQSYFEAGLPTEKFLVVSHYFAHSAGAYYLGPFDKCLVIAMDGFGPGEKGEPLSGQIYKGEDNDLVFLENVPVWGSLGLYYGAVTKALGFKLNDGEGKTMGLAAYGNPKKCYKNLKEFFPEFKNNKWIIKKSILDILSISKSSLYEKTKTKKYLDSLVKKYGEKDVAAACQKVFEEQLLLFVKYLVDKYGEKNLILTGGTFLNVVANKLILDQKWTEDVWVFPNPADSGNSMGAAIAGMCIKGEGFKRKELLHSAFGREYSDSEILNVLKKENDVKYKKVLKKDLAKVTAKMLVDGEVVGWFQGRDEWGPRALGQRSVIADPRKLATKKRINSILKRRDWFMPFAPSMLEERASDYLVSLTKAPFMIFSDDIKKSKRKEIQAAIHIDDTARPQLVTKKANLLYWQVIKEFEKLTGVGVILNTSFNRHGLPIVYSPKDAVDHLLWGAVDALVIGNYVVYRNIKK